MKKLGGAIQLVCLALERDAEAGRPARGEMSQELKQALGEAKEYVPLLERALQDTTQCLEDVATDKGGWAWEELVGDSRNLLESSKNYEHLLPRS